MARAVVAQVASRNDQHFGGIMTQPPTVAKSDFDLDVTLVEVSDPASMVNLTDDNCGSTCGACTTNVA
nr:FxLD family lanthipeptide [Streptomyces sp. H27-H1]